MTAGAFFLERLPGLIAGELTRYSALQGCLAFSCDGEKYTVRLGDLDAPVVPGFDRTAAVKVWFFGDGFARFCAGEPLLGKEHVLVRGDGEVLRRFGRFLQPAPSALSIRFALGA